MVVDAVSADKVEEYRALKSDIATFLADYTAIHGKAVTMVILNRRYGTRAKKLTSAPLRILLMSMPNVHIGFDEGGRTLVSYVGD